MGYNFGKQRNIFGGHANKILLKIKMGTILIFDNNKKTFNFWYHIKWLHHYKGYLCMGVGDSQCKICKGLPPPPCPNSLKVV